MRVVIPFLLCLISFVNIATAEVTCSTTTPEDGCEAGCYELSGACIKCKDNQYSSKGAKDCSNCTNIPNGATPTGPSTSESCTWKITCDAGKYWDATDKQCKSCAGNTISSSASNIVFDGKNISGNTSCTACPTYTEANSNHTECIGNVYKIELKKNCTICTVNENPIYEKYNQGFSYKTDNPSTWTDAKDFKVDLKDQNTSRWWGIEFSGYYTAKTGGNKVINADGTLVSKSNTQFPLNSQNEVTTLYAQYDQSSGGISITYKETDKEDRTEKINLDNENWKISNPSQCTSGQYFTGWKCTSGCTSQIIFKPNQTIQDIKDYLKITNEPLSIILEEQTEQCEAGYYCTCDKLQSIKNDCPAGSTSDEGSSAKSNCHIVRGTSGTKFCDSDGCFTLPGEGNIPWARN